MTDIEIIKRDFAQTTQMLDEFVKQFDEEYGVDLGSDFACDSQECMIYYAIAMPALDSETFRDDFIARFPSCFDFDIFTLSFMHEIGHCETEWDMVNDIKQRERISKMKDRVAQMKAYYKLHNEQIATDWAGEYLTEHHDEMKIWEQKILALLVETLSRYPDA